MKLTVQNLTDKKLVLNSKLGALEPKTTLLLELTTSQFESVRSTLVKLQLAGSVTFKIANSSISPSSEVQGQYQHVQSSPSLAWTLNHNLGYYPTIDIFTPGGKQVVVEVVHVSVNQAQVLFKLPATGSARAL